MVYRMLYPITGRVVFEVEIERLAEYQFIVLEARTERKLIAVEPHFVRHRIRPTQTIHVSHSCGQRIKREVTGPCRAQPKRQCGRAGLT
jgi:hypothetical protein